MLSTRKIIATLTVAAIIGQAAAAGTTAFSYGMFAPISGKQAAAAAIAQTGGYAKDVDFEYNYHIGGRYEVGILSNGQKYEVIVDATNGKILASQIKAKHKKQGDEYPAAPAQAYSS